MSIFDKMFDDKKNRLSLTGIGITLALCAVVAALIFVFAFTMAAIFPAAIDRCESALPDTNIVGVRSVEGQILCRTLTAGADAEVWIWLDSEGVVLK